MNNAASSSSSSAAAAAYEKGGGLEEGGTAEEEWKGGRMQDMRIESVKEGFPFDAGVSHACKRAAN